MPCETAFITLPHEENVLQYYLFLNVMQVLSYLVAVVV